MTKVDYWFDGEFAFTRRPPMALAAVASQLGRRTEELRISYPGPRHSDPRPSVEVGRHLEKYYDYGPKVRSVPIWQRVLAKETA